MAAPRKRPPPRIIVVAGGKGGVGKSTVTANLGLAIGRLGHRVTMIDADLGAANLHTMLGIVHPTVGLAEFFDRKITLLDEARLPVGMPTVALVPGTSRPGAANLSAADKARLLRAIARLDADCVVIDVGAGTSFNVVDLVAVADIKLFVVTPQLPALHNAYALLKACVHRVVRKMSRDETEQAMIDSALGQENKARTIAQLVDVLRPVNPEVCERIDDQLGRFGVGIVGNQVATAADTAVLGRMTSMIYDHLRVQAPVLATVRRTPALAGGLKAGVGTVAERGDDTHSAFRALAAKLLEMDLDRLRGVQRVSLEHTMPLWIQRELEAAT